MFAYLVGLVEWGLEASILDQTRTVADHLPPSSACLLCVFLLPLGRSFCGLRYEESISSQEWAGRWTWDT